MNVPADALLDLAMVSGAPTSYRAEGVVRWASEKVRELKRQTDPELRAAAARVLRYLTDAADTDHKGAVEQLTKALKGTT